MTGIYKITNIKNGKVYVGKANDIVSRWSEHRRDYKKEKFKKKHLYLAFRKHGIENFKFEVLQECKEEELNMLEKSYISKLSSFSFMKEKGGYNTALGGDGGVCVGETNGNCKLTDDEVFTIREFYREMKTMRSAFDIVKEKVSFNTFHDVWKGNTWKHINYEVYTKERKRQQRNNFSRDQQIQNNRKLSDEEVLMIRDKKNEGLTRTQVYESINRKVSINTFNDVWYNKTFSWIKSVKEDRSVKHHKVIKQDGERNPISLFSNDEVFSIREMKENGANLKTVYDLFQNRVGYACFYNVWIGKSYSNIKEKE